MRIQKAYKIFEDLLADQPPFTPSAPVQRRLQGPPAKSKFLAINSRSFVALPGEFDSI